VEWTFRTLPGSAKLDTDIPQRIHDVYLDGFDLESGWSLEKVETSLGRCDALGLVLGSNQEVYGYALYCIAPLPLQGRWFLWEDAICLRREAQRFGLAAKALAQVRALYSGRDFGWIGGRTQSPIVMRRYSRLGPLFPFDRPYTDEEGMELMDFMLQHIAEVREAKALDRTTGICAGQYGRTLGRHPHAVAGTEAFEDRLAQWGFSRSAGDAVVVVARVEGSGP